MVLVTVHRELALFYLRKKKKYESQHEIHTSLFFIIVTGEKKDSST